MKLLKSLARRADFAVSVFSPRPSYFFGDYAYQISKWLENRAATREWATTTLRITRPGWHVTRDGREVYVKLNTEGVYDKLAFVVYRNPEDEPHRWMWTVDERGWAYPHALTGYAQRTPMDIVL